MYSPVLVFGLITILYIWCSYQSYVCNKMADAELDSFKQGTLYRYANRFKIASYVLTLMGMFIFVITCLF